MRASGASVDLLFTENDSNRERLFGAPNPEPYVKDGIHEAVVHGKADRVNTQQGSKMAGHVRAVVAPERVPRGGGALLRRAAGQALRRLRRHRGPRLAEADAVLRGIHPPGLDADQQLVSRQAFAGLLWSKQYYHYDVYRWLKGDPRAAAARSRWKGRNQRWKELHNADVISCRTLGSTPGTPRGISHSTAWRWPTSTPNSPRSNFVMGRVVPARQRPVPRLRMGFRRREPAGHRLGRLAVYRVDRERRGEGDTEFLKEIFQNEMLNFNFWVNRKDSSGRDIFGGGFLGMDNIACFDRDKPLPDGGQLEQSDGTSWMALYCITMLTISAELRRGSHLPEHGNQVLRTLPLHRPCDDEHRRRRGSTSGTRRTSSSTT